MMHINRKTERGYEDVVSFDAFTFRLNTRELSRFGQAVPLPPKASAVLARLLKSSGTLVTREQLYSCAWDDTVIEFDHALNTSIRQIRAALGDDARNPRFVETVPRRGYRFCHPIERGALRAEWRRRRPFRQAAAAVVLVLAAWTLMQNNRQSEQDVPREVAVTAFQIMDGRDLAGVEKALEASVRYRLASRGLLRTKTGSPTNPPYLLTGIVAPTDEGARVQVTLVRASDGSPVWSGAFNPYCPDVKGNVIALIGGLVARSVHSSLSDQPIAS